MYNQDDNDDESFDGLHKKDDGVDSSISQSTNQPERGKTLICIIFLLELLILAGVIVLEYFLRWSKVFPIRKINFTCTDPAISLSEDDSFSTFAFNAIVPTEIVYSLSLCVPPFVMFVGEMAVWAFTEGSQKSIRACCHSCKVPQVIRRLLRFIGVYIFGLAILMIFVDVIKLFTGRLRPNFLEVCKLNMTLCVLNGNVGSDELCTVKDDIALRHARMSFPSLRSAITAYAAVYLSIYIHGAIRTRSVKVLRPFISLVFAMMALLCGLSELGLNHNYWTDVVVGWGMGVAMAMYLGGFVLYNFKEYVSERKLIRLLHAFLVDHQLLSEITKDGKLRLFPVPFHIPRAHTRPLPYSKFDGIKPVNAPLPIYAEYPDNTVEKYQDHVIPTVAYKEDYRLSHL